MVNLSRLAVFFILFSLFSSIAFAETKGGCIPGTYLIQEGNGAKSLWTFSKDGTIQFASSAQGASNFSDGHGAWKQSRSRSARATVLDFTYSNSPAPAAVARVDAEINFSKKCSTLEGSIELRFFDPESEDPLDVASDSGDPITDTITGRRVTATK